MKVNRAMHRGVVWFSPETPITEIARKMSEDNIGAVPIGENDRLVGMVTDRDIVCRGIAKGKELSGLTARDVMTNGITYCMQDNDLEEALELMQKHKIRRLPVIDQNKRMVGMLSLSDISHLASDEATAETVKAVSHRHH
jgi:CBS domain-containing protein